LHRKRVLLYGAKRLGCMHLLRCDKTKTLAGFRRLSHWFRVGLFVSSRRSSLPLPYCASRFRCRDQSPHRALRNTLTWDPVLVIPIQIRQITWTSIPITHQSRPITKITTVIYIPSA